MLHQPHAGVLVIWLLACGADTSQTDNEAPSLVCLLMGSTRGVMGCHARRVATTGQMLHSLHTHEPRCWVRTCPHGTCGVWRAVCAAPQPASSARPCLFCSAPLPHQFGPINDRWRDKSSAGRTSTRKVFKKGRSIRSGKTKNPAKAGVQLARACFPAPAGQNHIKLS